MSTSLFTAEEKRQVRWFVMRAYKNEKMAEDRLKDKEYGLEYFIETLCRKNLSWSEVKKVGAGYTESAFRPRQPFADH